MRVHEKLDGSTDLLDLDFVLMFRVIGLKIGDDDDSDGTLFPSNGKTLSACRILFA